jgi:hypothetical protein
MKRSKPSSSASAKVTSLGARLEPVVSARVGAIVGTDDDGRSLVDFEGCRSGGLPAESMVPMSATGLAAAVARQQAVVLLFDGGDPLRPIIAGLVAAPAASTEAEAHIEALPELVEVDGRRVDIRGRDEIVLRCGEASITLRRNGKIILKGTYLESHSRGTNRIKGAAVRIN